jgi:hypothetical protein
MNTTPPKTTMSPVCPHAPVRRVVFARTSAAADTIKPCNLLDKEYMCDASGTFTFEVSEKITTSQNSTLIFCKGVPNIFDMDEDGRVYELTQEVWPPSRTHKPGYILKTLNVFPIN